MADKPLGPERTAEIALKLLMQRALENDGAITTESCRGFVEELEVLGIPLPEALQFADMFLDRMIKEIFRRAKTTFVSSNESPPPSPPADEPTVGDDPPTPPEEDEIPFGRD
jgi:hypothetical protein